jgi:outer membrane protein assembly factor BamB
MKRVTPEPNPTNARPHARTRAARATAAWAALAAAWPLAATAADWTTYRGSAQRTGNVDGKPGPVKTPAIEWVYKAQEHYVSSPVPTEDGVLVGGLGAFNTGVLHALATKPDAARRLLWSKTTPFVKRPTVCAPAVVNGIVVFGDGMHQTDDATLYGVHAKTGRPLWQYAVPGRLTHLEGAPTARGDRVFAGGGAAGVLCLSLTRLAYDGREWDAASMLTIVQKRWAELTAKYEQEKKKDPDFATAPSDGALPKASPVLLWQAGKGQWHVDAPTAMAGETLLVASAYLDEEKEGRRALIAVKAGEGAVLWETPLAINPWAGPTVADGLVLVGCSSIRYDTKEIAGAKGEIVAVDAATGTIRWRKPVPGGVLSSVAVAGGLAVFTATDGQIRALDAATGSDTWSCAAKAPFFAGPAIAGDVVYAADLNATVHAVARETGVPLWRFDLANAGAAQLPGMVYGSPLVHDGRLFLATCNVEGAYADKPCMVACLSDRDTPTEITAESAVTVDATRRMVSIPCRVAPRKLETLADTYPLEVLATFPAPRGQKAHETVVTFETKPSAVHRALESLGLRPGKPVKGDVAEPGTGSRVALHLEWPGADGTTRVPIEATMLDTKTGRSLPPLVWRFTGSSFRQSDPDSPQRVYGADLSGTLVTLFPVTDECAIQSDLAMKNRRVLRLETNRDLLPPVGTPLTLTIAAMDEGTNGYPIAGTPSLAAALRPTGVAGPPPPLMTEPLAPTLSELVPPPPAPPPPAEGATRRQPHPAPETGRLPMAAGRSLDSALRAPAYAPACPPPPALPVHAARPPRAALDAAASVALAVSRLPRRLPSRSEEDGASAVHAMPPPPVRTQAVAYARYAIPEPDDVSAAIRMAPPLADDLRASAFARTLAAPTVTPVALPPPAGAGGPAVAGVESVLLPAGSVWKFRDDGQPLPRDWRAPGYDDGAWKSGPARLGYGGDGEVTTVNAGSDQARNWTTYFRAGFQVAKAAGIRALRLRLLRDDGAVVYLNGAEIRRENMPDGEIAYQTPATVSVGGEEERTFAECVVDASRLVDGPNVLAVEIHQFNPTSSDISFDLELRGIVPAPPAAKP